MLADHHRIVIVGSSCSGKSTLARHVSRALDRPHIELDALYWGAGWTRRPDFRDRVADAVQAEFWVADGNYREVRDLVWARATAIIWLNMPFALVIMRALRRTGGRIITQERLYSDNRESIRGVFFNRDSILRFVLLNYHKRRREFRTALTRANWPTIEVFELRTRADVEALRRSVNE